MRCPHCGDRFDSLYFNSSDWLSRMCHSCLEDFIDEWESQILYQDRTNDEKFVFIKLENEFDPIFFELKSKNIPATSQDDNYWSQIEMGIAQGA